MGELIHLHTRTEPWITKRQLCSCIPFGQRWVETMQTRGLPYRRLGGKNVYQLSAVEDWLRENGHLNDFKEGA